MADRLTAGLRQQMDGRDARPSGGDRGLASGEGTPPTPPLGEGLTLDHDTCRDTPNRGGADWLVWRRLQHLLTVEGVTMHHLADELIFLEILALTMLSSIKNTELVLLLPKAVGELNLPNIF